MSSLSSLIDQGVHAFTRGQVADAARCWRAALELEPGNRRALAYLKQLESSPESATPPAQSPAGSTGDRVGTSVGNPGARGAGGRAVVPLPLPSPDVAEKLAASPWDQGPASGVPIVLEPGEGLDLSAVADQSGLRPLVPERARVTPHPAGPKTDVETWMGGARELFALGDFSGSLEMIEKILRVDTGHDEAWAYLEQNEATLIAMYESKLGPLAGTPRLAIKPEEVMWLNLDHRAGFLLAQIDGTVSYEDLFALSGLPRLDTAKILATLLNDGVIR